MIEYIGLLTVFIIIQTIAFYIYKVAMKRLRDNPYRNIELTAVAMVEEEKEEEKVDPEEQKAYREGQILIPEPEITLYYEL
tara:strand:+ start:4675 stop:4917 length:243 start_codon:yes stop_codon:yes gene_type:complete